MPSEQLQPRRVHEGREQLRRAVRAGLGFVWYLGLDVAPLPMPAPQERMDRPSARRPGRAPQGAGRPRRLGPPQDQELLPKGPEIDALSQCGTSRRWQSRPLVARRPVGANRAQRRHLDSLCSGHLDRAASLSLFDGGRRHTDEGCTRSALEAGATIARTRRPHPSSIEGRTRRAPRRSRERSQELRQ